MKTLLKYGAFCALLFVALVLFATDAKAQACNTICDVFCAPGTTCVNGTCRVDHGQCDVTGGSGIEDCQANVATDANDDRNFAISQFLKDGDRTTYLATLREIGAKAILCHQACSGGDTSVLCEFK